LALEWIDGRTVRRCLDERLAGAAAVDDDIDGNGEGKADDDDARADDPALLSLMHRVGAAVGALHAAGVVHGDLTTSNLMIRPPPSPSPSSSPDLLEGDVVLIDFGLATQSVQDEDRAVDLYVLERAFASTHPAAAGALFRDGVLGAYARAFKGGRAALRRLDEVRLRGRKRSMLG
jgi:TP53 regulating kinase-like protein